MFPDLVPQWFLKFDIIFDVIFTIATGAVAWTGWRAYRFFKDERHRLHSTGFILLTGSYLVLALAKLAVYLELNEIDYSVRELVRVLNLMTTGSLLHAILFLAGVTILLVVYLHIDRLDIRLLLFTLVLFGLLLSHHLKTTFALLVAALLLFIIIKLVVNARKKRSPASLLVALAFVCVFIGEVLLALMSFGPSVYVAASVTTLIGYVLLITSRTAVS